MSWSEVQQLPDGRTRIVCHRGDIPACGVCNSPIKPRDDCGRSYGGLPLCLDCSADVDANPAFKAWAERQIDKRLDATPPVSSESPE